VAQPRLIADKAEGGSLHLEPWILDDPESTSKAQRGVRTFFSVKEDGFILRQNLVSCLSPFPSFPHRRTAWGVQKLQAAHSVRGPSLERRRVGHGKFGWNFRESMATPRHAPVPPHTLDLAQGSYRNNIFL
jgi:hypothetical protein